MKLCGLSLETAYFEDYLSFLVEVLELELFELTDISMKLDLQGTWLEIKKVPVAPYQVATHIEFDLTIDEFLALKQKVTFFYYRRGPSRFLPLGVDQESCSIVDPDGRLWRFKHSLTLSPSLEPQTTFVRNC